MTTPIGFEEEVARLGADPSKVARALGLNYYKTKNTIERLAGRVQDGLGREELRPYIVAHKLVCEEWSNTNPEIARARLLYDEGLTEMCTGRVGNTLILYSIPRDRPTTRRNYFSGVSV